MSWISAHVSTLSALGARKQQLISNWEYLAAMLKTLLGLNSGTVTSILEPKLYTGLPVFRPEPNRVISPWLSANFRSLWLSVSF